MSKMSNLHILAQETFDYLRGIYTVDEIYTSPALILHIEAFLDAENRKNAPLIKEAVKEMAYDYMKGSLSYAVW